MFDPFQKFYPPLTQQAFALYEKAELEEEINIFLILKGKPTPKDFSNQLTTIYSYLERAIILNTV